MLIALIPFTFLVLFVFALLLLLAGIGRYAVFLFQLNRRPGGQVATTFRFITAERVIAKATALNLFFISFLISILVFVVMVVSKFFGA